MDCLQARECINRLVDAERLPGRTTHLGVLLHCAACADCRALRSRLKHQRNLSRSLPILEPAPELRDRVLSNLDYLEDRPMHAPLVQPAALPRARSRRIGWLILAGQLGLVAALALFFLLGPPTQKKTLAASVREAVGHANSWHLVGWKRIKGQQLRWEIWGRRHPFFYREQVGDEWTLDNGRQRVQVWPPRGILQVDPHATGLALRLPSRQGPEDTGWSFETMFRNWREDTRPYAENAGTIVLNFNSAGMEGFGTSSDYLYTVNKRVSLPLHYELRRHSAKHEVTTAELLDATYNVAIPTTALQAAWPKEYRLVDALAAPQNVSLPTENALTQQGLTAQAQPLAMDDDGNVVVRVRGWLGGVPLDNSTGLDLDVQVAPSRWEFTDPWGYVDDRGRKYVQASSMKLQTVFAPGERLYLFAPLEPLAAGAPLPKELQISLGVGAHVYGSASGTGNLGTSHGVVKDEFNWTVRLPKPAPFDIESFMPANWRDRIRGVEEESQPCTIAHGRAYYYGRIVNYRDKSPEAKERTRQNTRWMEEYLRLAPADSTLAQLERMELARTYRRMGRPEEFTRLLHDVLRVADEHPKMWSYYRKSAEEMLAKGK